MTLRLIGRQHLSGLRCQCRIDLSKTFSQILVYRSFAHLEFLCRLTHSRSRLDNVIRDFRCALFDIFLHKKASGDAVFTVYAKAFYLIS